MALTAPRASFPPKSAAFSPRLCVTFASLEVSSVGCCRLEGRWEWEASSLCRSVASRDTSQCSTKLNAVKAGGEQSEESHL